MKANLQLFGGRGGGSGLSGGAVTAGAGSAFKQMSDILAVDRNRPFMSDEERSTMQAQFEKQKEQLERKLERGTFKDEGGGQWQMDVEGVGGASIIDETGGSRDPEHGRGGKAYSVKAWDADYNTISSQQILSSLNEAKSYAKNIIKQKVIR